MTSYDFSFIDWISIGLNKDSLTEIIQAIDGGKKINDRMQKYSRNSGYIGKILREEIFKQFEDKKRPSLETVLNAIDARPKESKEDYLVKISYSGRKFIVEDFGTGMTLNDILTHLTIPFSTKKNGLDEIGRFGVGFLSTFNYCITQPKEVHVLVDTSTGKESYSLDFYSTSDSIEGLRMRLRKNIFSGKAGTRVIINKRIASKKEITNYLTHHLNNVPSPTAKITLGGKQINSDKDQVWHNTPIEFNVNENKIIQRVGLLVADRDIGSNAQIKLNSQGIPIRTFESPRLKNLTIYFPSAVKVVEGRDEFKIDANYRLACDGVFLSLTDFLRKDKKTSYSISEMAHIIPALASALSINDISQIKNIDVFREALFGNKKYVLDNYQASKLEPFFGKSFELAVKLDSDCCSFWRTFYGSGTDMINDLFIIDKNISGKNLSQIIFSDTSFYPNLIPLLEKLKFYEQIIFGRSITSGSSAFIFERSKLFVNTNHPYISGEYSKPKAYGLLQDYFFRRAKFDPDYFTPEENAELEANNQIKFIYIPSFEEAKNKK